MAHLEAQFAQSLWSNRGDDRRRLLDMRAWRVSGVLSLLVVLLPTPSSICWMPSSNPCPLAFLANCTLVVQALPGGISIGQS